jgi:hypothetical protein
MSAPPSRDARDLWAQIDSFESRDRLRPAGAGAIAGAIGGATMLWTADTLMRMHHSLPFALGREVTRSALDRPWTLAVGFAAAMIAGALTGAAFGVVTRHLRRFAPLLIWAVLFFPAAWVMVVYPAVVALGAQAPPRSLRVPHHGDIDDPGVAHATPMRRIGGRRATPPRRAERTRRTASPETLAMSGIERDSPGCDSLGIGQ